MPGKPAFPPVLTNASWQSHKGIVAKVVKGETGVGAALTQLKKVYDAVEWQYFIPDESGPLNKPRTLQALDERFEQAKGKARQLETLRAEAFKVRDLCTKLGDKWEKSIVVPKSTRIHVQKTMAKACEDLALDTKSIGDEGYKRVRAEIERIEKAANQMFAGWVDRLEKVIPKAKSNKTVKFYQANMHQQVRGLGTAISKMPQYKKFYTGDNWDAMVGDGFMRDVTDGDQVKAKVEEVEKAFKKLKAAIG